MEKTVSFGAILKQWRKTRDLTQSELADRVGCSPSTIRMAELGGRRVSKQLAALLAECLNIPQDERAAYIAAARQPLVQQTLLAAQNRRMTGKEHGGFDAPAVPSNLPAQLTALIGREDDSETLKGLLRRKDVRLVTLTGLPGVGKTSLAIEVATDLQEEAQFRDGSFWVALAAIRDRDLVIPTIARLLDVQGVSDEPLSDALKRHLRPRHTLLLLDNFEQVIAAAPQVADLLAACANLKVLVTSREPLAVRGEREFNVQPLLLPEMATEGSTSLEVLATSPAVELFVERAQAVDRSFLLTEENAPLVAAICTRLDGLPLAIELVAARTRMLPLAALLQRLQDEGERSRLNLLSGGGRDLSNRHKTLRDAIGWSYDLLTDEEQALFRRLGAFSGGFSLASAEAVCYSASNLQPDLFEQVSQLVQKNLVKREHLPKSQGEKDTETRFSMVETIREYALERLEENGEKAEIELLHAEYFMAIASNFNLQLIGEDDRLISLLLDRDYDNVGAAFEWTIEQRPVDMALSFGISLGRYWELRGHYRESRAWLLRIAATPIIHGSTDPAVLAKRTQLLVTAGRMSLYMPDLTAARASLEEGLATAAKLGPEGALMISSIQANLAHVERMQGDYTSAIPLYETSLAAREKLGNIVLTANAIWGLGIVVAEAGDLERAESLLHKSLAMGKELVDTFVTCGSLRDLGTTLCYNGKYEEATLFLEESLTISQKERLQVGVSWTVSALGFAKLGLEEYAQAEALFRESLRIAKTLDKHRIPDTFEGLVEVEIARWGETNNRESLRRAATLLGAAEAVRRILKGTIMPVRVATHERLVAKLRSLLSEDDYERYYKAGKAMSIEEGISYG